MGMSAWHAAPIWSATFADLDIGGIEPEIGPVTRQRSLEEGVHALVDILAKLGDRGLGDAAHALGLDQLVDAPRADAGDPGLLDHRDECLLDGITRLQEAREVGVSPELGIFSLSVPRRVSRLRSR
jgi:hypothetical protein